MNLRAPLCRKHAPATCVGDRAWRSRECSCALQERIHQNVSITASTHNIEGKPRGRHQCREPHATACGTDPGRQHPGAQGRTCLPRMRRPPPSLRSCMRRQKCRPCKEAARASPHTERCRRHMHVIAVNRLVHAIADACSGGRSLRRYTLEPE